MKYIFSILFALLEVFIVFIVLVTYESEGPVLSGLVIIYAIIRSFQLNLSYTLSRIVSGLTYDIFEIKRRIRDAEDLDEEKTNMTQGVLRTKISNVKLTIRAIGVSLIFVIGLLSFLVD